MRDRERGAETQAEGEAGSMQGARRGIRSRVSRIVPWAKDRRQTAVPPRDPSYLFKKPAACMPVSTFGCNLPSLVPSLWNCQSENVGVLKFLFLLVVEDQTDQTCLSNT